VRKLQLKILSLKPDNTDTTWLVSITLTARLPEVAPPPSTAVPSAKYDSAKSEDRLYERIHASNDQALQQNMRLLQQQLEELILPN
jgi:hypothetical protein